jgi:hypothetical protein
MRKLPWPAGRHAANPGDFTVRPRVEIASTAVEGATAPIPVPARVRTCIPLTPGLEYLRPSAVRDE